MLEENPNEEPGEEQAIAAALLPNEATDSASNNQRCQN